MKQEAMEKSMVICFFSPHTMNGKTGWGEGLQMAGRRGSKSILIVFMAVMVGWPAYQLYDGYKIHTERHEAVYLLYQVALFQMEMLNRYLDEVGQNADSGGLDGLKQAAYSAAYTHERLVLASGKEHLTELQSLPGLLQFILRLEIGGKRPLGADESLAIRDLNKLFKNFYAEYAKLFSSDKNFIPSQNEKLAKTDRAMADLLRKKRLE
jgi:hypothetical protein